MQRNRGVDEERAVFRAGRDDVAAAGAERDQHLLPDTRVQDIDGDHHAVRFSVGDEDEPPPVQPAAATGAPHFADDAAADHGAIPSTNVSGRLPTSAAISTLSTIAITAASIGRLLAPSVRRAPSPRQTTTSSPGLAPTASTATRWLVSANGAYHR